ncbi:hypothetical protein [Alteribacter aurantiacus]|uniref:hypothetical protein n=1 Tax=Alteribacter aurantiacus TaxID=254410 RepID=UPI000414FA8D|nr:hypothetical protein [Alteribacter aurantiacus]
MFFFLIIALITTVAFFNSCVKIAKQIRNGEDEGAERILASTLLGIAFFCTIFLFNG